MDRRGALLIATAIVPGFGIHGALQLLAARQAAKRVQEGPVSIDSTPRRSPAHRE